MVHKVVSALCDVSARLTDDLDQDRLDTATRLLDELPHPLGTDDIAALLSLLPEDGDTAHGLNWTILHAIEASPEWPLWDLLADETSEWVRILRLRLVNAGYRPPGDRAPASLTPRRPA